MKNGIHAFFIGLGLMSGISGLVFLFFCFGGGEFYPRLFPVIPVFYTLNSIPLVLLFDNYLKRNANPPSLKQLMLIRMIKTIGSICVFVVGLLLDKSAIVSFAIVFVIFYAAYSIFETKLMLLFQKKKKI